MFVFIKSIIQLGPETGSWDSKQRVNFCTSCHVGACESSRAQDATPLRSLSTALLFYCNFISSRREKQNAGPCQTCLAMPEIGNTEPSYSGTSWERICPVHHCPVPASPRLGGDHLPSSSHTLGPVSTQSNGQVPSSSQDSQQQQHLYHPCNQQESRGSYSLPPLPGHEERPMLCSHLSSSDPAPASHHEASETPWKQWSPGQRRPVQHHIVTVR